MLKWPDREAVDRAVRAWARNAAAEHPELLRAGYFGSYARGDWGVGSDVDLVAVVERASRPWPERAVEWDLLALPVAAQLLVYTADEWETLLMEDGRFARTLHAETSWVFDRA